MKLIAHGIDLIECDRIQDVWRQRPDRFIARILTQTEREYCLRKKNPLPHIAGRFAAKEAIMKVLGTGWRGQISWTDIEITNDQVGQPHVELTGHCRQVADELGMTRILISITHTQNYAAASAIAMGD